MLSPWLILSGCMLGTEPPGGDSKEPRVACFLELHALAVLKPWGSAPREGRKSWLLATSLLARPFGSKSQLCRKERALTCDCSHAFLTLTVPNSPQVENGLKVTCNCTLIGNCFEKGILLHVGLQCNHFNSASSLAQPALWACIFPCCSTSKGNHV